MAQELQDSSHCMQLYYLKRTILLGLILVAWEHAFSVTPGANQATEACRRVFGSNAFAAAPSSRDDINLAAHTVFADFANEQVNIVLTSLQAGQSVTDILARLANARQALAVRMNQANSDKYGSHRITQTGAESAIAVSNVPAENYLPLLLKYDLIDPLDYRERFTTFYKSSPANFGRFLEASRVTALEDQPNIFIVHPNSYFTQKIFDDVVLRAEIFRNQSRSGIVGTNEEFLRIAYGFFVAMPYQRGSAAIGRIFLEALYYHLHGRAANLPADIDILALVLPEEHFLTELSPLIP